jgi:chromosome condensin MukBEF complex kleisin-like MukF subunit
VKEAFDRECIPSEQEDTLIISIKSFKKTSKTSNTIKSNYCISGFIRGRQISRFSSKMVEFLLAVFNFHDSEF